MKKYIICMMMALLTVVSFAQVVPLVDRMSARGAAASENDWEVQDFDGLMLGLVQNATKEEINMRSAKDPECGATAIFYALIHPLGGRQVIRTLLAKGADVTVHDCSFGQEESVLDICPSTLAVFVDLLNAGPLEADIIKAASKDAFNCNVIKNWAETRKKEELLKKIVPICKTHERNREIKAAKDAVKKEAIKQFDNFLNTLNLEDISEDTIQYKFVLPKLK